MPTSPAVDRSLVKAVVDTRSVLLRQAQRMMRDRGSAEDAAQDALLAALSNLRHFRGDAQLNTWLYRVAANAVLMNLRRERRTRQRTVRALARLPQKDNWLHGSGTGSLPQHLLEEAQSAVGLRRAIARLPAHYRAVVQGCDLDERPLDEVAASLGVTVGGLRTRRLRAHRMLKDALLRARKEEN